MRTLRCQSYNMIMVIGNLDFSWSTEDRLRILLVRIEMASGIDIFCKLMRVFEARLYKSISLTCVSFKHLNKGKNENHITQ